jgi:hypothetical protein
VLPERPNPAEASAAVVEASTLIDWMLPLSTQLIVRVRGPIISTGPVVELKRVEDGVSR